MERHYSKGVVKAGIEKAKLVTRDEALKKVVKVEKSFVPKLSVEFDKRYTPAISKILESNYKMMIDRDKRLHKVFPSLPLVVNRRGKTIKELLCRAKIPRKTGTLRTRLDTTSRRSGLRRCGGVRQPCSTAPFLGKAANGRAAVNEVTMFSTNTTIPISDTLTCKDKNVIYVITCEKDKLQYVGETGREGQKVPGT